GEQIFNLLLAGAVKMAVYFGGFEELAAVAHRLEFIFAYKVIINSVLLRASSLASGVRNRESQVRHPLQHSLGERRLAGAGRRGHDYQVAAIFTRHSDFAPGASRLLS